MVQIRAESSALPETVASSLQQPQTEADIWGPMQGTRRILLLGLSLLAAASFGWLASAWVAPQTSARGSRVVVDKDVEDLLDSIFSGSLCLQVIVLKITKQLAKADEVALKWRQVVFPRKGMDLTPMNPRRKCFLRENTKML